MTRLLSLAAALAATTGCIFVDADGRDRNGPDVVVVDRNDAPLVLDAVSACYYDDYNRDDVWWFQAVVDDPDGVYDVVSVFADVYDEPSGQLIQSFELYPTDDPYTWFSDWLVSSTYLDCWYPLYTVDIVVYDAFDAFDAVTIFPDTYR